MDQLLEILSTWNWAVIAACVSAFAAIVALILSFNQVRLSNKQNLFNRRLSIWLITQGMLELYRENHKLLKKEDEPQFSLDVIFAYLTNNAFLYEIGSAAFHPLDMEYQKPFLTKLDEIKSLSAEAKFVFEGCPAEAVSGFLNDYQQLLMSIYQYQVLLDCIEWHMSELPFAFMRAYEVNEPLQRSWLYEAYDSIEASYTQLNSPKLLAVAEKQIRLTRK